MNRNDKPPVRPASERLWNISKNLCEEDFNPFNSGLPDLSDEEWTLLTDVVNHYVGHLVEAVPVMRRSPKATLLEEMAIEAHRLHEELDDHSSRFRFRTDGWVKRFIGEEEEEDQ